MRPARFLAVHLPAFRLERCGWQADEVAVLVAELRQAMRLVALTPAARAEGLARGMTAAAARARVPEVAIEVLDPAGEHEDRRALRAAFTALSDRVAFPWEDELILEIGRVAERFGGERALAEQALALARELGHLGRVAVADHPRAAAALARVPGRPVQVLPPGAVGPLAELPVGALHPSDALREALRAVGVERLGQLARLDPASVAGRFGTEGERLHRVARGQAPPGVRLEWSDPVGGLPAVRARLGGATSTLQIHFVLPGLLARLADRLADEDLAAVRLQVVFVLEEGWDPDLDRDPAQPTAGRGRIAVGVRIGRPTRQPAALEALIRQRIDGLELPAPVDELHIELTEVAPGTGWQPGLTDRAEAREPLPDLLARLGDHLGPPAVAGVELVDHWRPERAWRPRPWPPRQPHPPLPGRLPAGAPPPGADSDDPVEVQQCWEPEGDRPRPVQLLPEPVPLRVREEGGRPVSVHLADRGWTPVGRAIGPERLCGEWWEHPWERDYWVITADGRTAWVFRDRARDRWALHGWF